MLKAFDNFVMRTPALSTGQFLADFNALSIDDITAKILTVPAIREAVYLSSPDLVTEAERSMRENNGNIGKIPAKVKYSLLKYYTRLCTRSTPFGLFAACSVGSIGKQVNAVLSAGFTIKARLDMDKLYQLNQAIAKLPVVRRHCQFYANTSIAAVNETYRYARGITDENHSLKYELFAFGKNEFTDAILQASKQGIGWSQLLDMLTQKGLSEKEAAQFTGTLIDEQIIVPELQTALTGKDPLAQLTERLAMLSQRASIPEDREALQQLTGRLENMQQYLETLTYTNFSSQDTAQKVEGLFSFVGIPFDKFNFLQIDTYRHAASLTLNPTVIEAVKKGVETLSRFSSVTSFKLRKFHDAFAERFEERLIPIGKALDPDIGIGYPENNQEVLDENLLADKFSIKPPADKYSTLQYERKIADFWTPKIIAAQGSFTPEIQLTDAELAAFPAAANRLQDTFAVLFSLRTNGGNDVDIMLDSAGGSSGANTLSRFAHTDPAMESLCRTITDREAAMAAGLVTAEITHLPDTRSANILVRPALRQYEIPYLSGTGVDTDKQIALDDLFVQALNGSLHLYCRSLKKYVHPKLTSAHNYQYKGLPVYQFLCDLQHQHNINFLSLNLGYITDKVKYIPRITFKNITFQPRTWNLVRADYAGIFADETTDLAAQILQFRNKFHLPENLLITDGDNELFFHLPSATAAQVFKTELTQRKKVRITECFKDIAGTSISDHMGNKYFGEFILPFYKTEATKKESFQTGTTAIQRSKPVQRKFLPMTEWSYYKIYAGIKSCEKILARVRQLMSSEAVAALTEKWFFVRFYDPKYHIRLRVKFTNADNAARFNELFNHAMTAWINNDTITNLQLAVYERETERYQPLDYDHIETIFHADAVFWTNILCRDDYSSTDRLYLGIKLVNTYLDIFGASLAQKHLLINSYRDAFAAEFGIHKRQNEFLGKEFRARKEEMDELLKNTDYFTDEEDAVYYNDFKATAAACYAHFCSQAAMDDIFEILGSIIHMSMNRLFRSKFRQNEFLVYDALERHYRYTIGYLKNNHKKATDDVEA